MSSQVSGILCSMTTEEPKDPPKPRRRWFRYSLRTLLIVVAIFCIIAGTVVKRANDQKAAVAAIRDLGGRIAYANQFSDVEPLAPEWLRKLLGDDYFFRVGVVIFMGPTINDGNFASIKRLPDVSWLTVSGTEVTDAGLVHLEGMTNLHMLTFGPTKIDGSGLVHLEGLTKLHTLGLSNTGVGDESLAHLSRLTSLEKLFLDQTKVTDRGLEHLKGLTRLAELRLKGTAVTDEGVSTLQQALPNCTISR